MKTPFLNRNLMPVVLIALEILTVTIPVAVLGSTFQFPDILRQPARQAFTLFAAHQSVIMPAYYIFMVSGLLYIPLSYVLGRTLAASSQARGWLNGLGLTTALLQALGFSRWIFLMPYLTEQYFAQPGRQDTIALIYETMNRYAGMTVGEHLGFLSMAGWTITLGWMLLRRVDFPKWLGIAGIGIGLLLALSVAEQFGGPTAAVFGTLNFLANTAWTGWLLVIGIRLWIKRPQAYQVFG